MFAWLKSLGNSAIEMAARTKVVVNDHRVQNMQLRYARMKAKYDILQKGVNDAHFSLADDLSANQANSPEVRRKLRRFSRYEIANNSYAKGIVLTYANELVGSGPRLQIQVPGLDDKTTGDMEADFREWAEATGFNEKLHTFAQAKISDGEGCAAIVTDPDVPHDCKLDIVPFEAEQLATPNFLSGPGRVDGIEINKFGKPQKYHVLDYHPGEFGRGAITYDTRKTDYSPKFFIHWYRPDRPGQFRGIPELTPSLPLFAQLRRWTLAMLTGAETAANFAAILYTDSSIEGTEEGDPWDEVSIQAGVMTTLPAGYRLEQLEAQQPVSNHDQFKREILKEIARCQNMPYNVVSGDSSLYNYSSGRLDHQNWVRAVRVARASLQRVVLRLVLTHYAEESFKLGRLPRGVTSQIFLRYHNWFWDALPYVDPVKDGQGDKLALENNTDTLANICALQGRDWREVLAQRKAEVEYMKENGLEMYLPNYASDVQLKLAEEYGEGQAASYAFDIMRNGNGKH